MQVPATRPAPASTSSVEGAGAVVASAAATPDCPECAAAGGMLVICLHCWRYIAPDDFMTGLLSVNDDILGFVHAVGCAAPFEDHLAARRGDGEDIPRVRLVALV
jgi:hypothetical protein